MSNEERAFGQFLGNIETEIRNIKVAVHDSIKEYQQSVKDGIKFMTETTERLKAGCEKFDDMEERIKVVEARECPSTPNPKTVYGLIVLGFTLLALMISLNTYISNKNDKLNNVAIHNGNNK